MATMFAQMNPPKHPGPRLRYIDRFLAELARGALDVEKALGQHLHWGFHEDPDARIDDPSAFAVAAELMNVKLIELAEIGGGDVVLDAGCGFGGLVKQLNRDLPGIRAIGLNHDIRQLDQASKNLDILPSTGTPILQANALRLPFASRSFDAIIASELLCHLDDGSAFFREAGRTLKPGGRLIVGDHVVAAAAKPCAKVVDLLLGPMFGRLYGRLNCTRTVADFSRLAEDAGLAPEERIDVTRNTLPNYRLLRRLMRGFDISFAEKRLNDLISLSMESAARTGAFKYALMKFQSKS
jgi:SAM-dependent methyltransferase